MDGGRPKIVWDFDEVGVCRISKLKAFSGAPNKLSKINFIDYFPILRTKRWRIGLHDILCNMDWF